MDATSRAEEARRLLDNEYRIILFRDGLGQYSALAVPKDKGLSRALREWREHEPDYETVPIQETIFDGPNRYCGCGLTIEDALHAVAEKVLLRQLPGHRKAGDSTNA